MFPKSPLKNDRDFIKLLKDQNVLVVPGSAFGKQGYFRISYCVTQDELEGSIIGSSFKKSSILNTPLFFKSNSLNSNTELVTAKFEFNDPVTITSSLKS